MESTAIRGLVARGVALTTDDLPLDQARRIVAGHATARDILGLFEDDAVGQWWGLLGVTWDMESAETYADSTGLEESLAKWVDLATEDGDDYVSGEVAVVLVGVEPPELAQDDEQIWVPAGTRVVLTEIRYNAGRGWVSIPSSITVTSGLSLEAVISVAEQAMERAGLAGSTLVVPTGHQDDPGYQAAIQPLIERVRHLSGVAHLRVFASDYILDTDGGGAQAMYRGNAIVLRPVTNEMTLLHEVAHAMIDLVGERGHTEEFCRVASDLYAEHLSPAAGEMFWRLVSYSLSVTSATNPPGLDWCKVCGKRVIKRGTRWTHMRPMPSGPNDHNAVPGGVKKVGRIGVLYRGMTVVVPEGEPVNVQTLLAASQKDRRWGLGPHWTPDRSVAESFSCAQDPWPVPQLLERRPGVRDMPDPWYKGPRGTGISVVFEVMTEAEHDEAWSHGWVMVPSEKEVSLRPGVPMTLVSLSWFEDGRWVRGPMGISVTAAGPSWRAFADDPFWMTDGAVIITNAGARGRSYEVYDRGQQIASRHSLAEAKASIEGRYGPLQWEQRRAEPIEVLHYHFGPTEEFTEPTTYYTAELPDRSKIAMPWTLGPDEADRCTEAVLMQFGIFGRRPRNGLGVLEALMDNGWTYRAIEVDGAPFRGTVRSFYENPRFKTGRYYLASSGHAMAMIDGTLVDTEGKGPDGRRIIGAFEVWRKGETARVAALEVVYQERGTVGNNTHITYEEKGTVPIAVIADMKGVMGEVPGEHRNRRGEEWGAFKADIKTNGITNPIFITVDYGDRPRISEGNHRRDAAVEVGLSEVSVLVRYFGHAEQQGTLLERSTSRIAAFVPAAMHVVDEDTGGEIGDYCLPHGFAELAAMRAQGQKVSYFLHEEGIKPGTHCIVCVDERNSVIGARDLVLYHGTLAANIERIRRDGLTPPETVMGGAKWYMLTTSRGQAERYTMGRPDAVVLEYHIPETKVWEHGRTDTLLWPGDDNDVYGFECVNYAIKEPVPESYLVAVHPVSKTAAVDEVLLWRGDASWGSPEFTDAQDLLEAIEGDYGGLGQWWGDEKLGRFYGATDWTPPSGGDRMYSGAVVAVWWSRAVIRGDLDSMMSTPQHEGVTIEPGVQGRLDHAEVWTGEGWKRLGGSGMRVTADRSPRLYHGTMHDLEVGTILESGVVSGNWGNAGSLASNVVWLSDDPDDARSWAQQAIKEWAYRGQPVEGAGARVYEVEPMGEIREWAPPDHLARQGIHHYTTERARIVGIQ